MITFNFDDETELRSYDDNYENLDQTIDEEAEETCNTEDVTEEDNLVNDDSDSGIDSLYECIKFRNNSEQLAGQNKG